MWQLQVWNNGDFENIAVYCHGIQNFESNCFCQFVDCFGIVSPDADNGKEMKNTWIHICVYRFLITLHWWLGPPPTYSWKALTVMRVRLVLDKKKGGDSWWKDDFCTWFCMSRRCAIPSAGWTGQGQPQLSLSELIKKDPFGFFLPS